MAFENFSSALKVQVDKITQVFTNIPGSASALMIDRSQTAMAFRVATPTASCAVAGTDDEVSTLKAQTSLQEFLDRRHTVYWYRDEPVLPDGFDPDVDEEPPGEWLSEPYTGQSPQLQPYTLVLSMWDNVMYYLDEYYRLTPVNLTTQPTPN